MTMFMTIVQTIMPKKSHVKFCIVLFVLSGCTIRTVLSEGEGRGAYYIRVVSVLWVVVWFGNIFYIQGTGCPQKSSI